jgi:signal transduction histidine kinase
MRFRLPLLFGLALALAVVLSIQAIALLRDRAGVARRAQAARLDEIARTVALRIEYQLLSPMATAVGHAMFDDSAITKPGPTVGARAERARRNLATCACAQPSGLAVSVRGSSRPVGDHADSITQWLADTLARQVRISHLASYNLVGRSGRGRVVFGFMSTRPPMPVRLFGYGARIAPADTIDDLFAIELAPTPFLTRALRDTTINPGTDTGELAFRPVAVTLDVADAAGRPLYAGTGERWAPGLVVRALPVDLGSLTLRMYAARTPTGLAPTGGGLLLVLALFVITIVLAAIALLQLRGEHELARRRARFVSGVSHELRTPLTQIRLFAELLRDANPAVQAKRFEYARIIDEEAQRLTYLVDNVLAYSGLSEVTVRRENVAFSEIVQDTVERFEPLAASRAAKLRVLVPEGIVIAADDHALRRVLLNVLDNAVKYGPQGQTVCIALHVVDHSLQLTVDDAGPGIPIADRMRVFEPFVRLDHNAEGGTGIGLAIVHDLVAAMRGTVVIEEAPSGGTRVRLTWPL